MPNHYRIEYSYLREGVDGKLRRRSEVEYVHDWTAQEAVDFLTRLRSPDLQDFRIEAVYRETRNCWDIVDCWT